MKHKVYLASGIYGEEATEEEETELTSDELAAELRILQRGRSFGDGVEAEDFRLMRERYGEDPQ